MNINFVLCELHVKRIVAIRITSGRDGGVLQNFCTATCNAAKRMSVGARLILLEAYSE